MLQIYTMMNHLFLHLPFVILVMAILPYGLWSYPVFGTTRFGRSTVPIRRTSSNWDLSVPTYSLPSYQQVNLPRSRLSHYPTAYYNALYPYAQDYLDDYYYPQEPISYPLYYAPARGSSKYSVYQAFPYYYDDRRSLPLSNYGYYNFDENTDPVDDLQEEILQEEREQREEALPIGQETWYEGEAPSQKEESIDDVNAAFLQNLIMSHMYNDVLTSNKNENVPSKNMEGFIAADDQDYMEETDNSWYPDVKSDTSRKYNNDYEDEEVRELKSLQKSLKNGNKKERKERKELINKAANKKKQNSVLNLNNDDDMWVHWNKKRLSNEPIGKIIYENKKQELSEHGPWPPAYSTLSFSDRKSNAFVASKEHNSVSSTETPKTTSSTAAPPKTDEAVRNTRGGQKEVVLLRPATPVRHPFAEPVIELLEQEKENDFKKKSPSVYDTIKHLLDMEDALKEKNENYQPFHNNLKKRLVSNEGSLVNELVELKKMST